MERMTRLSVPLPPPRAYAMLFPSSSSATLPTATWTRYFPNGDTQFQPMTRSLDSSSSCRLLDIYSAQRGHVPSSCTADTPSHVYVPMWYTSVPVTKSPLTPLIQTDESPPLHGSTHVGDSWTGRRGLPSRRPSLFSQVFAARRRPLYIVEHARSTRPLLEIKATYAPIPLSFEASVAVDASLEN
ncbi:hypothetical protein ARMGADRAFT_1075039 [Armillaria gallica]|uniref:Uncharacterized protein n=1 Tax=Armillaria gallica TaxID=47427 RepID=A0A2H3E392_ARMGA|nr:hypothetical protein ARMGADRAFT_1075039 [Armillaria gallica]